MVRNQVEGESVQGKSRSSRAVREMRMFLRHNDNMVTRVISAYGSRKRHHSMRTADLVSVG